DYYCATWYDNAVFF
nr:immunoglobulin light chain junction region [Macaca mulatta]